MRNFPRADTAGWPRFRLINTSNLPFESRNADLCFPTFLLAKRAESPSTAAASICRTPRRFHASHQVKVGLSAKSRSWQNTRVILRCTCSASCADDDNATDKNYIDSRSRRSRVIRIIFRSLRRAIFQETRTWCLRARARFDFALSLDAGKFYAD